MGKMRIMLDCFKDGKKVAEADVTNYTLKEAKKLIVIQVKHLKRTLEVRLEDFNKKEDN